MTPKIVTQKSRSDKKRYTSRLQKGGALLEDMRVLVRNWIDEGVTLFRAREERFPEEKKKRALAAIARFSSNASDVSERHDDYLAMVFSKVKAGTVARPTISGNERQI